MLIEMGKVELEAGLWALFIRIGKRELWLGLEPLRWRFFRDEGGGLHLPGLHIATG